MNRSDFTRAVAKSTGENINVIVRRGFNLVDDTSAILDDDIEAMIADWEMMQAEQAIAKTHWRKSGFDFQRQDRSPVSASIVLKLNATKNGRKVKTRIDV